MLNVNLLDKRVISVKVPGTCGEWIQTVAGGRECLVSLPINRFTKLDISFKEKEMALHSQLELMPKSQEAFQKVGAYLKLSEEVLSQIHFEIQERLEIGKGMASSTADISAIMAGVAALVDQPLSGEVLLKMACEIEPSDGIMFDHLVLIDHLQGAVMESFDFHPNGKILMLKPVETYITESMRTNPDYAEKIKYKTEEPLNLFREGIKTHALEKIGKSSTLSLLENESILEKPFLGELIKIAENHYCYGVVGGHSGTVCGFLLNEKKTDLEKLIHAIEKETIGSYYASYEIVETYSRGIKITFR